MTEAATEASSEATTDKATSDLELLDDLLMKYYEKMTKNIEDKPKLGDFLKMIELRRKLTPHDASQKDLWAMLEKVREEVLARNTDAPTTTDKPKEPARQAK